jgi:hypothetical protein
MARDTRWESRADGYPGRCPTEGRRALVGGGQVPDGGRVSGGGPMASLGGGPTGEYIRAAGPRFWTLSSSAQSHLQKMRVRKVSMSESIF